MRNQHGDGSAFVEGIPITRSIEVTGKALDRVVQPIQWSAPPDRNEFDDGGEFLAWWI